MSADVRETGLPGVLSIHPVVHADPRGVLVKTHLRSAFAEAGLPTDFPEQFVSRSVRGVVRGLHHQLPPGEHEVGWWAGGAVGGGTGGQRGRGAHPRSVAAAP